MKIKLIIGALIAGMSLNLYSQSIRDDFNDYNVDSSKWQTFLPSFHNASVTESFGKLCFVNGAWLTTVQQYADTTISGRFEITGWVYDRFKVMFRSDGISIDSHWQARMGGLGIQFTASLNPDYGANKNVQLWDFQTGTLLAYASAPITLDTGNNFSINDDGEDISVTLNGVSVLNYSTPTTYGNFIEVGNREMGSTPIPVYLVDLDYLQVDYGAIVPEPSQATLGLLGGLSLLAFRRFRGK